MASISKGMRRAAVGAGMLFIATVPAGAVEPGFKEVQVNSGYTIIADEDMEIRRTGGHVVIEDLSTANTKKIRRLQDEIAKLRAENQELRQALAKFETQLDKRLDGLKADIADLRQELLTRE